MRCRKYFFILFIILAVSPLLFNRAYGDRLDYECVIYVEPGDSYLGLFGADWLRVFNVNRDHAFNDTKSGMLSTPDRLVVGERLIVPAGVYLTDLAIERLNRYENIKKIAFEAILKAENFTGANTGNESHIFQQGRKLLLMAKESAQGASYGFGNYVRARELAEEAIRCFEIDRELSRLDNNHTHLREATEKERASVARQRKIVSLQQQSILWIAIGILSVFFIMIRMERKKERLRLIGRRLERHSEHIKTLEGIDV
ncbi:hypothetical protein JXL19_09305 [bacterium]|nr:hypothetical protein [bacterium]